MQKTPFLFLRAASISACWDDFKLASLGNVGSSAANFVGQLVATKSIRDLGSLR